MKALPLRTHSWNYLDCGSMHYRDKNAANNITAAGMQTRSTAGRAGAPPFRLPAAKQKPEL
ncbi:hypothetical protein JJQ59_27950 [Cupriavidus necator]|uniref:Transposase n=1 Tax=Cupriavidus necator TaxID=106590 RepID=A0A367PG09_CUPNE|nr:hypothetical protein JJQ59_27950 [Cupriavidus necator]RCJ06802.1 hypothetical protein DDK22_19300 [Cupriavidus necator]